MKDGILKGDLMKQSIVNAPPLSIEVVQDALVDFLRGVDEKFVWLNSRELNYNMVFDISKVRAQKQFSIANKDIAEHISNYLAESSFCQPRENILLADKDKEVEADIVPMSDIRDISFDQDKNEIDMFIGLTHFKLSANNWIVEKVK